MTKFITTALLLCVATFSFAQNDAMSFKEVLERCATTEVPYVGADKNKLEIASIAKSFAKSFPGFLFNMFADKLSGKATDEYSGELTIDKVNGYCRFVDNAGQYGNSFTTCFWKKTDGTFLIGLAFDGSTEEQLGKEHEVYIEEGDELFATTNSLFFFTFKKGDSVLKPVPADQIMGRRIDYRMREVQLPQHGKNIKMIYVDKTIYDNEKTRKEEVYKWNDGKFTL